MRFFVLQINMTDTNASVTHTYNYNVHVGPGQPLKNADTSTLIVNGIEDEFDIEAEVQEENASKSVDVVLADETDEITRTPFIKSIGSDRIGAYGVLWGTESDKDLHDEYFTAKTSDLTSVFEAMGKIPMLFDHGNDDSVMKSTAFAAVDKMEPDDVGLWFEAQIQKHDTYRQYVKPLVDQRKLFPSSGTLPAAKRVTKSGEITRWPIVEMTATPTPAEYRMLDIPISQVKAAYKSIGVTLPNDIFKSEEPETEEVGDERANIVSKLLQELEMLKIQFLKHELENEYNEY